MSSNDSVEDVLASIRRLVSDDRREPAAHADGQEAPVGRLVLTPSLRISNDGPADSRSNVEPPELPAKPFDDALDVERVAALVAEQIEAETVEPLETADSVVVNDAPQDVPLPEQTEVPEAGFVDVTPEPESTQSDVVRFLRSQSSGTPRGSQPVSAKTETPEVVTKLASPDDLSSKVAALEAMIGYIKPDAELEDDAPKSVEHVKPDDADAPSEDQPARTETRSLDIEDEQVRAVVAALVRTELRGALGESISHSVRKLVRQEIRRALASQQFD